MGPTTEVQSIVIACLIVVSAVALVSVAQEYPYGKSSGAHMRALLREPMPWEDGYFDPSYHAWPKSSGVKQSASEKSSLRALVSNQQVNAGSPSKRATGGFGHPVASSGSNSEPKDNKSS